MTTQILSTADTHIGFRQYGLIRREQDIEKSFKAILKLAVEKNVAAITVSGDIIHSVRPTAATISFLKECNKFLEDNKLPCLVSIGNHDLSSPHWLTNISNPNSRVGFIVLDNETFDLNGIKIFGATFTSRDEFDQGRIVPEGTDLLLMHQPFDEFSNFPNDKLFTCDDLLYTTAKAVIVGDIHINRAFECYNQDTGHKIEVHSPGSTELISESENSDKYVLEFSFEEDKSFQVNKVQLVTRPVLRLEVRDENDFESCVKHIRQKETMEPLVFLKFSTTVENVMTRFRTIFDSTKLIIRPKPMIEYNGLEVVNTDANVDLTYADVLSKMMPTNSTLYTILTRLLDPGVDVHSIVDTFIEQRSKELGYEKENDSTAKQISSVE